MPRRYRKNSDRKKNKKIKPEQIGDDFFDKNCHKNNWLKELFYEIDRLDRRCILRIGGEKWADYKRNNDNGTPNDDDERIIQTKLLASFTQSKLLENELKNRNRTEWNIEIGIWHGGMVLDDWKPLLLNFDKYNLDVKKIKLVNNVFSETGFQTLIWLLDPHQSGFLIQNLEIQNNKMSESAFKKWIPSFSELPIKNVESISGPSWLPSLFKQHCRPPTLISDDNFYCDKREDQFRVPSD